MTTIPKSLLDLGAGVVIVFMVLLIIVQIVKLVGYFKDRKTTATVDVTEAEKHPLCIASPIISTIVSNQAVSMETNKRLEAILRQLSDNSIKQTFILDAMQKYQDTAVKLQRQQSYLLVKMCTKMNVASNGELPDLEG